MTTCHCFAEPSGYLPLAAQPESVSSAAEQRRGHKAACWMLRQAVYKQAGVCISISGWVVWG